MSSSVFDVSGDVREGDDVAGGDGCSEESGQFEMSPGSAEPLAAEAPALAFEAVPPARTPSLMAAMRHVSPSLHGVVTALHQLTREERLEAMLAVQRLAFQNVYAGAPHPANTWYLPQLRRLDDGDDDGDAAAAAVGRGTEPFDAGVSEEGGGACRPSTFACGHDPSRGGVWVRCGRWRLSLNVLNILLRVGALVLLWGACATIIGRRHFVPGGVVFDPVVAVVVSLVTGAAICRLLKIPPLVGVLFAAMIWSNIPRAGRLTSGIRPELRKFVGAVALVTILSRAGLALSLPTLRAGLRNALLLATIPFVLEAFLHALLAYFAFGHNSVGWAALQGLLCSSVAPAIAVPGVLTLQEGGYRKAQALSLILCAVALDVALGIFAANFVMELLLAQDANLGLLIALGPIQLVAGVLLGILQGLALHFVIVHVFVNEAIPLPTDVAVVHHKHHDDRVTLWSATALLSMGLATYGGALALKIPGGGAIAVATSACVLGHMYAVGGGAKRAHLPRRKGELSAALAFVWDAAVMPVLFTMVGTGVSFADIFGGAFFGRALGCVLLGVAGRIVGCGFSSIGTGFTAGDVAVVAMGWIGKASVQGALGPVALLRVEALYGAKGGADHRSDYDSAEIIKNTAVLSVLLMAPLSSVLLTKIGPLCLTRHLSTT